MGRVRSTMRQIALRVPCDLLERVEVLAKRAGQVQIVGGEVLVSEVLREALEIGIANLEKKLPPARRKKAKRKKAR